MYLGDDQLILCKEGGSVSTFSVRNPNTTTTWNITNCITLHFDVSEKHQSYAVYQGFLTELHTLDGISVGDIVLIDGSEYVILDVIPPVFGDPYIGTCLSLGFYNFNNTIQHLRPQWTKDEFGSDICSTYNLTDAVISCRIQPISAGDGVVGFKRVMLNTYNIYLLENLNNVVKGDILRGSNNKDYKIVKWTNKQDVADLMKVECVGDFEEGV